MKIYLTRMFPNKTKNQVAVNELKFGQMIFRATTSHTTDRTPELGQSKDKVEQTRYHREHSNTGI